jgi:hypothetical protein
MRAPRWLREAEEPPPPPEDKHPIIRFVLVRQGEPLGESGFTLTLGERELPFFHDKDGTPYTREPGDVPIVLVTPEPNTQPLEEPPPHVEEPKVERRLPVSSSDVPQDERIRSSSPLRDRSKKPNAPGRWGWVTTSVYRDRGYWHDFDASYPESGAFMVPEQ